ncbi:transmembrane and ubiquitin-like domain-containing protein 1 isoform X1 [Pieris napi]|uniref:transmembrane and ubiquitin-like domain-containing protein 1 isoform X1 n=1 Tax=Pieris napi TaxID=78633 RepID=UPI001FBA247F|nr:transmembrane and ubiquitin-like domain-containing protein 1 isoform X1 [Pieris napi]
MSLIAGVGDEVIQFMITVMVIVIASLAWWSTNSRPDRYRTVFLMRSRGNHPVTVSIRTRPPLPVRPRLRTQITPIEPESISTTSTSITSNGNHTIPIQEMDSIVDADMAMLDNNRLHFYRVVDATPSTSQITIQTNVTETETHVDVEPASEAQIREMDSIVSAMEADVPLQHERNTTDAPATSTGKEPIPNTSSPVEESEGTSSESVEVDQSNKILIKLKYLNETLKEVEGSLDELLKDFKGRHFAAELSSDSRVRLIFNGRVLVDEAATLRACGLHHQAVVHALIHPKRNAPPQQNPTEPATTGETVMTEPPAAERSWDLENILMTLVSVAVTVVWFFRCEYSNMFTVSASVALFGLTVFYSIAIFGLYLSDTFHFERRPHQLPNN